MWIVELALRRPLSVAVIALLMLVLGALSFAMMNVDIFPAIKPAGRPGYLQLPGPLGDRHGTAHHSHQRACRLDHRERY